MVLLSGTVFQILHTNKLAILYLEICHALSETERFW